MSASELFRLVASSHVLLLVVVLLRGRQDRRARLGAAYLLCVACYLLVPLPSQSPPTALFRLLFLGSVAAPFAFWLLARELFDDDFRLRAGHAALFLGLEAAHALAWAARVEGRFPALRAAFPDIVFVAAPRLLSVLLVLDALRRIVAGARVDLVESRLRVRYAVLGISGSYVLLILVGETVLRGATAHTADLANVGGLLLLVFAVSVALFRLDPDFLGAQRTAAPSPPPPMLVERLNALIEEEHIYRKEGLTIGALAARLREPEYRVRQLVNAHLGFRNFNAFLHHYRIQDARESLRDPARRHLGIADIAFELGYQSLGPFNKAFKDLTGQTPTEYRKSQG